MADYDNVSVAFGPSTSNPKGGGRRGGHRGWLAMDNRAASTSQKWQRCRKSKVAKREGGGVFYLLLQAGCTSACTQLHKSRNQYEITKPTAKKYFCTSGRDFCTFGAKNP